jgi:hypothetical protein
MPKKNTLWSMVQSQTETAGDYSFSSLFARLPQRARRCGYNVRGPAGFAETLSEALGAAKGKLLFRRNEENTKP